LPVISTCGTYRNPVSSVGKNLVAVVVTLRHHDLLDLAETEREGR
jgi:hypothetical protein